MMTPGIIPTVILNNGMMMPQIGLGVWKATETETEQAVKWALESGYRLLDTAAAYNNEAAAGRAIKNSHIHRSEIFVTTKLANVNQGYDETLRAFDSSMKTLGLNHLDLYLIHWPMPAKQKFVDTWRAFEQLYSDGRIRAIGVSNFQQEHLQTLMRECTVMPAVNQIELHPYLQQADLRNFCLQHDIYVESWSPLGRGGELLQDSVIAGIAKKHAKTPAQIIIRWHIQSSLIVIPRSVHQERIQENIAVFDFELDETDMRAITALNQNKRLGPDPDTTSS